MTVALVLLVLAIVIYVAMRRLATSQRRSLGLEDGEVVAADHSKLGLVTLRSDRLGLVGRPDQILRAGRAYIPVEQKPSARRLYQSHVMQVAAQCMLVHEAYGVRPPFGVVVLAGGRSQRVMFTPELERRVLETMHAGPAGSARDTQPPRATLNRILTRQRPELTGLVPTLKRPVSTEPSAVGLLGSGLVFIFGFVSFALLFYADYNMARNGSNDPRARAAWARVEHP